jgi:hypothetical protein
VAMTKDAKWSGITSMVTTKRNQFACALYCQSYCACRSFSFHTNGECVVAMNVISSTNASLLTAAIGHEVFDLS